MKDWLLARLGFYPCINGPLVGRYRFRRPDGYRRVYPIGDTKKRRPAWMVQREYA